MGRTNGHRTTKKDGKSRSSASARPQSAGRKASRAPSHTQWKDWKSMQQCKVIDPETKEPRIFKPLDNIRILNCDWDPNRAYPPSCAWVGQIKEIRGNSPGNVWMTVQWYWSGKDIAERAKGTGDLDTSFYGKFERSRSLDEQLISLDSVNGIAQVIRYDETSLDQEPIPDDAYYTRSIYHPHTGSISAQLGGESPLCLCGKQYNPDRADPMHFCARDGCRRWYHARCLRSNGHIFAASRAKHAGGLFDTPCAGLQHVPPEVLATARTSIVRGGKRHGVAGNVKRVCEARKWVRLLAETGGNEGTCAVLRVGGQLLEKWLEASDGVEVEAIIACNDEEDVHSEGSAAGDGEAPLFVCPSCSNPI
ncbi:hypothetical protein BC834DRAFT_875721 [Gloeopeniophorella convolvens]|nr:hypothetical protein BC834DRAFT_875721 [Gloeopeniophorella convolvens]